MKKVFFLLFFCNILFAQKPNIIFILTDDMGWNEFGFLTNSLWETPTTDSIREEGCLFTEFYVNPVCTPTRSALMSGKYPFRYGLNDQVQKHYDDRGLPDTVVTLAEYLKEEGYQNAIFGKWHLNASRINRLPSYQGFDHSFTNLQGQNDYYTRESNFVYDLTENGIKYQDDTTYFTKLITDKALAWIDLAGNDDTCPFFAFLSYTSPHLNSLAQPQVPSEYLALAPSGWTTQRRYEWAMNKYWDEQVSRIWHKAKEIGNTIVIVTADNGGASANAYNGGGDNSPFAGDKGQTLEGGTHVPLIWWQPGVINGNTTYDSLTHIVDVLPTLVKGVAGHSTNDFFDGQNLWPYLSTGTPQPPGRWVIPHYSSFKCWGIRRYNWSYHNNKDSYIYQATNSLTNNKVLYNLSTDVGQTSNVIASNATVAASLEAILGTYSSSVMPVDYTGEYRNNSPYSPLPSYWGNVFFYNNPTYYYYEQNK